MKKMYLLLGLMTAVTVPSIGSAKLVLDVPPILAAGSSQETCTVNGDCSTGFCCNGRCYAAGSGACCNSGNIYCSGIAACTSCANPCDNSCNQPATGGINDTGITFGGIYPSTNSTLCAGGTESAAQDCATGRDVTGGGFSFTQQGNCVKDNVTGLTWSSHQGEATWSGITTKVTTANTGSGLCGMTGWRAPTLKELLGIASYHSASSAYPAIFSDTNTSKPYWSGTEANSNAWAVSFIAGATTILAKSDPYYLRLVNGTVTTANLKDNTDGTVTDSSTKLMWKKCLEGLSGSTCGTGAASTFTWQGALQRPGVVNGAGFPTSPNYKDWRLPNIKELQSIVDASTSNPAISTVFPNVPAASQAWSSSPYAASVVSNSTTYWKSWMVNFASGTVVPSLSRESTLNVRLVRDVQ